MIEVIRSATRGHFDHGWLDTRHTFSFADYYDPERLGFRHLRVINEDRVTPGSGFPTHAHRDMEIISYVIDGALQHADSIGNGSVIRPGDVQRMTAGSGVRHSESNASDSEPVHFLQIWIIPDSRGLEPGYEQKHFGNEEKRGRFRLVASPKGADGSVTIHQDVRLYAAIVAPGEELRAEIGKERFAWLQVIRGSVETSGTTLTAGDGAALAEEEAIVVRGVEESEVLLFDLA